MAATISNMASSMAFLHPALRPFLKQYELIEDCLMGEQRIKHRRQLYLPKPNPSDESADNTNRYNSYLIRSVFYNVAQRTQGGLVGQIFLRDPAVEVPGALDVLVDDATGEGVPLHQLAQEAAGNALAFGRSGLYVDYPFNNEPASIADIQDGEIRPSFTLVKPWRVLNWRVKRRGTRIILSLVMFIEEYTEENSESLQTIVREQWRVLRLVDDVYVNEVYRLQLGGKPYKQYIPTDASGKVFNEIPFTFIGSQTNDSRIDLPPMYDICSLNIGHYRNSADYEESVFYLGQPTPWFSGLNEQWVKEVMGGAVALGSRGAVLLPVNGAAGILQVEPNSMAKEAMEHKEAQMLALGAKLVEGSQVQRTATEADIDNTSETSILSTVARNVSQAIVWALKIACKFQGVSDAKVAYDMNTEFDLVKMTFQDRAQLLKEWQSGGIAFEEYRQNMRRAGIAYLDDKDAQTKIAAEDAQRLADAVAQAAALAPPADPNNPNPNQPDPAPGA